MQGDASAAELLASTDRKLDKAGQQGVIHKNQPPTRSRHWPRRSTSSDSHLPTHRPRSATNSATCRTAGFQRVRIRDGALDVSIEFGHQPNAVATVTRPPPSLLLGLHPGQGGIPSCVARRYGSPDCGPDPADGVHGFGERTGQHH